jgi:nucleoid-associated protein YgaU
MPPDAVRAVSAVVPEVDSYDEETYICRPRDTFDDISTKFYQDKKYSQALLLYNRSHPRRAAAIWKEPIELQEGQPIYIPPLRILEKHHGNAIPGNKPLPPVVVPAAGPSSGTSWVTPRGGAQYAVRQGEMIGTIAANTLGKWERWTEIYELNRHGFDPSRPLPAGSVLAMPADAKIPPENHP